MSCSKHLPPFTFDVLCYLNRNQLERFSIVCRPLKNLIERYFRSKPYRVFDDLYIPGGRYALFHNYVRWYPNRDDYSVQQFFAKQKCSIEGTSNGYSYHSFAEMRPYLNPTVRIKLTCIYVAGHTTYNQDHISEMESIAHLWRDGNIYIMNDGVYGSRIGVDDIQLILNSPTILQCQLLSMHNAHFSFKDYKVLYTVKVIKIRHNDEEDIDLWLQYWQQFLEQSGTKPVVAFDNLRRKIVDNLLERFSKTFSSAVSPNAFKIVFAQSSGPLTEFRETNNISREILELKKGLPTEIQKKYLTGSNHYTLERSNVQLSDE
ncbi:hypothetical protein Ddc_13197 [Ditylenchus destructor]|nr:hypothetical protein Ddc_13197 [Ditylenchus destructor]